MPDDSNAEYSRALPLPSPDSVPFWDGAKQHKLLIQKCRDCGTHWHPPSTICPGCGSRDNDWVESSGKGTVFSFVTYHRAYHEGWKGDIPYVVAVVELEEGARILSNVVGIPADQVVCDMKVEVLFEDVTDDVTLPKFRPV